MAKTSTRISIRGEQTREQILKAARRLFAKRGYHSTSVYDLFEDSGISKGAFFHHWKTKEELALTVFDGVREDFDRHFFSVLADEQKSRARIESILLKLSDLSSDPQWVYGRIFALWCAELASDEEKVGVAVGILRSRWMALWKELIKRAQQEHDLRSDLNAENLSFLVISSISGVLLLCGTQPGGNARTAFETLRRTLLT